MCLRFLRLNAAPACVAMPRGREPARSNGALARCGGHESRPLFMGSESTLVQCRDSVVCRFADSHAEWIASSDRGATRSPTAASPRSSPPTRRVKGSTSITRLSFGSCNLSCPGIRLRLEQRIGRVHSNRRVAHRACGPLHRAGYGRITDSETGSRAHRPVCHHIGAPNPNRARRSVSGHRAPQESRRVNVRSDQRSTRPISSNPTGARRSCAKSAPCRGARALRAVSSPAGRGISRTLVSEPPAPRSQERTLLIYEATVADHFGRIAEIDARTGDTPAHRSVSVKSKPWQEAGTLQTRVETALTR